MMLLRVLMKMIYSLPLGTCVDIILSPSWVLLGLSGCASPGLGHGSLLWGLVAHLLSQGLAGMKV